MNTTQLQTEAREIPQGLLHGPAWLTDRRRMAMDSYNASPLPRRGLHLWRYTDPARFLTDKADPEGTKLGETYREVVTMVKEQLADGQLAALVTDRGGWEIEIYDNGKLADDRIIVCPLAVATENHGDLVQEHLGTLVNEKIGKFEALNSALWKDGIFIYLPDNIDLKKPMHLLRDACRGGNLRFHRLLVVTGKNVDLTLIDEYGGGSRDKEDHGHVNSAVEIIAGEDSRVRYVSLQRHNSAVISYLTQRTRAGRGGQVLTVPLAFGGAFSKQNFGVQLDGPGVDSTMYGLLFGTGRQHFDNHTLHLHSSRQTTSNIDFKVVLRDRAMSAYTGLIRINKEAPNCEAYQSNRNLLLSKGVRAETIPELEILNEEVSCTHGATVGPIDPEMIYYLKCRGVAHDDAVRMIVSGFVESTLKLLPDDLRERIHDFVAQRLEDV